jgi:hypothetical protein
MLSPTDRLAAEISHCDLVRACRKGDAVAHPCTDVVRVQAGSIATVQVPEPWSGRIEHAPILFVSSNPSISSEESYPVWSEPADVRVDYFVNRFEGGPGRVEGGTRFPLALPAPDGPTHSKRAVPFWAAAKNCARLILGREPMPGEDYALTEDVHCKSTGETGVESAARYCTQTWMERILALSDARIIVIYGDQARASIGADLLGEALPVNRLLRRSMGGRDRLLVTLRHPNYYGVKRIDKVLPDSEWDELRAIGYQIGRLTAPMYLEQTWPPPGAPTLLLLEPGPEEGSHGRSVRLTWIDGTPRSLWDEARPILEELGAPLADLNDPAKVLAWARTTGWKWSDVNIEEL